jgi:transposase
MSARIQLKEGESTEALHEHYRASKDRVERARWQALWMISQGRTREEVAELMGYGAEWVRVVVARYNASGAKSIADGRHKNRGHVPLLDERLRGELESALEGASPDGTPWSGPKVARWMAEKLGRPVAAQRGGDYLRRTGHTPQSPRPRHQEASAEAQATFPAGAAEGA